eukprot:TRINITY_DN4375_c0_g2_i11.p1 TRINITY_DN4375_c0_g2~~TRINITY_DN4375_c0_g2_i11.p1  ORF type:complete len:184 (-),score=46.90 TRINITY_DN4375_c0_g2_i11:376-927(-)
MNTQKERPLVPSQVVLSCEEIKNELGQSIDEENRYTNTDSAKKKAVMQGMDYEGFRQMVLGANLKPIKTGELKDFSEAKPKSIFNPVNELAMHEERIAHHSKKTATAAQPGSMASLSGEYPPPSNFRELKKAFDALERSPADLIRFNSSYSSLCKTAISNNSPLITFAEASPVTSMRNTLFKP